MALTVTQQEEQVMIHRPVLQSVGEIAVRYGLVLVIVCLR